MRIKAKHPPSSPEYYREPYTVQHFLDWLMQIALFIPRFCWFVFRQYTSKNFRVECAREYNRAMFGNIPTSQIFVLNDDETKMRPLRDEERTWPE